MNSSSSTLFRFHSVKVDSIPCWFHWIPYQLNSFNFPSISNRENESNLMPLIDWNRQVNLIRLNHIDWIQSNPKRLTLNTGELMALARVSGASQRRRPSWRRRWGRALHRTALSLPRPSSPATTTTTTTTTSRRNNNQLVKFENSKNSKQSKQ